MLNFQGYVESDNDLQHVSCWDFWHYRLLDWRATIAYLKNLATHIQTGLQLHSCRHQKSGWIPHVTIDPLANYRSKCLSPSCLNPLHTFELVLDFRAVTTYIWIAPDHNRPRLQKDCSECRFSVAWRYWFTFELVDGLHELSPPISGLPQTTTDPSSKGLQRMQSQLLEKYWKHLWAGPGLQSRSPTSIWIAPWPQQTHHSRIACAAPVS